MSKQLWKIPKPGDTGSHVAIMQEALNSKGASLKVDGEFGPKTRKAVSEFQKQAGLTGTGVPGSKTIEALGLVLMDRITSGVDIDEGTPPWYRRMFVACEIDKGYEKQVEKSVELVEQGFIRYLAVSLELGFKGAQAEVFAWILGALHFKEASCNFNGVLHNGERIIGTGELTTLVPKGRGPFETWEEAAIDAINLNGKRWSKLREGSSDIGDILYAMERFNGTGYISGAGKSETSPYLWARSNINDDFGKYVKDGVFSETQSTQSTTGAAVILKELYRQGKFLATGVEAKPPMPLPDLNPVPSPTGTISRDMIADKILSIVQRDIDAELRETHGKNRSPRIDSFNRRAKTYMGAPYCTSGLWTAIDDACIALGLKNPVPPTASSQAFRRASFVPSKYIRPDGSMGKKGDFGVLQNVGDSSRGHLTILSADQVSQPVFPTSEYNTEPVTGDRDGDGAYNMTRSTIDRSKMNAGKIFVCFTDIPQWIFDANLT